jgi:hypothetical protein
MASQLAIQRGPKPTITRPNAPMPLSAAGRRRHFRAILIAVALEAGCSQQLIAEALGLTERGVAEIKQRILLGMRKSADDKDDLS